MARRVAEPRPAQGRLHLTHGLMLSMFKEKDQGEALHWSMTRVVAFMFSVTVCYSIILMARGNHAHDIGWPFCAIAITTLLAVPLQLMFKLFQYWMNTSPGQKLLKILMDKVNLGGTTPAAPSATVNVGTTSSSDKDK